jgi:hypothetical protein
MGYSRAEGLDPMCVAWQDLNSRSCGLAEMAEMEKGKSDINVLNNFLDWDFNQ